jgi:tubulin monoglycylase TTLL3/8
MSYDNQIFKFKEKIHSFNKTLKEMERSLLPKKLDEKVEIFIKEDKQIKKYEEQPHSDQDEPQGGSSNSEENEEFSKEMKKIKSEPKIEIKEKNIEINNETKINNDINKIKEKKEKTYYLMGGFPDFAESLQKRGWKECPEPEKLNYDFIFTYKIADIPFDDLGDDVIINHLRKIGEITKKTGLLKNIRNLYYLNIYPDDFYPRAYDLSEKQDIEDFIEDFKVSKAIALLRKCQELKGKNVNKKEIETALKIVKEKLSILTGKANLDNKFEKVKTRTFNRTYEKK